MNEEIHATTFLRNILLDVEDFKSRLLVDLSKDFAGKMCTHRNFEILNYGSWLVGWYMVVVGWDDCISYG